MDNQTRAFIYAFLSRVYSDSLDKKFLYDLSMNDEMLEMIGESTKEWFDTEHINDIEEALNIDFSSVFLMSAKPFESSVLDSKDDILVGLQNPVMQFYYKHDYELNLSATHIQTPDHISIELAFMQNLVGRDEKASQRDFLKEHLLNWSVPYFLGIKDICKTPFYKDLCDFTIEFLSNDFNMLESELGED